MIGLFVALCRSGVAQSVVVPLFELILFSVEGEETLVVVLGKSVIHLNISSVYRRK